MVMAVKLHLLLTALMGILAVAFTVTPVNPALPPADLRLSGEAVVCPGSTGQASVLHRDGLTRIEAPSCRWSSGQR